MPDGSVLPVPDRRVRQTQGHRAARSGVSKAVGKARLVGDGPIPMLVMKNPKATAVLRTMRIQMRCGKITDEEEVDLYRMAHCLRAADRAGEGFGLQPRSRRRRAGALTISRRRPRSPQAFSHLRS